MGSVPGQAVMFLVPKAGTCAALLRQVDYPNLRAPQVTVNLGPSPKRGTTTSSFPQYVSGPGDYATPLVGKPRTTFTTLSLKTGGTSTGSVSYARGTGKYAGFAASGTFSAPYCGTVRL